jgi:hypothetical protein
MTARGVHFALTAEEAARLVDEPDADDDHFIDILAEIEERSGRDESRRPPGAPPPTQPRRAA